MIPQVRASVGARERDALLMRLSSCFGVRSGVVEEFEEAFAASLGGGYALSTNSGLAALHLALIEFKPTVSSLWIPNYADSALITAADHAGFLYRLLDSRAGSFLADGRRDDGRNLRIGVHLFGESDRALVERPADTLIEDVSDATGAWLDGERCGTRGVCSFFSFSRGAVLCAGDGGLLFSQDQSLISQARDRASYEYKNSYRPRFAYRMTDLEAALGLVQITRLAEFLEARHELAAIFHRRLSEVLPPTALPRPPGETWRNGRPDHVYSRYCLRLSGDGAEVCRRLQEAGVEARPPLYLPLHRLLKQDPLDFPESEEIAQGTVSLPFYPSMTDAEVDAVLEATCRAVA